MHARRASHSIVTYVCFECCTHSRGCPSVPSASRVGSVCLRGGDAAQLEIARKILLYLTQMRLSLEREIAFYIDMGMTATSLTLATEPVLFAKKAQFLASSPNIIFGKYAESR